MFLVIQMTVANKVTPDQLNWTCQANCVSGRYEKAKYELESVKVMRRSFKIMFCKQRQGLQKFYFVMLI